MKISTTLKDYHGCGKAWASISPSGEVLGLRYMGDFRPAPTPGVAHDFLRKCQEENKNRTATYAGRAAKSAGLFKTMIAFHGALNDEIHAGGEAAQFCAYREKCREELASLGGEVVGGMCSCFEFIPGGHRFF